MLRVALSEQNKEAKEANEAKEAKEVVNQNEEDFIPTSHYFAEIESGSVIYEGYYDDDADEPSGNMIQLVYHNPSSCRSLQPYFQFEEKGEGGADRREDLRSGGMHREGILMGDYSVTINANGDQPNAMIRMIGDLLWALQREGHVSNDDLVHVNVRNDSLVSHFENIGFHHLARCIMEYPEQRLTSNPFEGEDRMAARIGDLLDGGLPSGQPLLQVVVDSGISLPQPVATKRPRLN